MPATKFSRSSRIMAVVFLFVAVTIGAGFGNGVIVVPGESSAQSPAPVVRELNHIGAWGRLSPRGEVRALAAPSTMDAVRVARLNVVEGQRVAENEVIAVLDAHERRQTAVSHAEAMLALAEAQIGRAHV